MRTVTPVPERYARIGLKATSRRFGDMDEVLAILGPVLADLREQVQALPSVMDGRVELVVLAHVLALLDGGETS